MESEWKNIERFNGKYAISNDGQIRNNITQIILKTSPSPYGYLDVNVRPYGRSGKSFNLKIHREVALAFIPNSDPVVKYAVNHIDGNKLNNHVSNLEWCTNQENIDHAVTMNLMNHVVGEDVWTAKLNDNDVSYILANYVPRCKQFGCRALGKKFGVSHSIISCIINGKAWKHVEKA